MQLEPIIAAYFTRFKEINNYTHLKDPEAFELFVNQSILSAHQPEAFNADSDLLDKVSIGGGHDAGIDGIVISLNGLLVSSIKEIDEIVKHSKSINVEFIFIQSKHKNHFDKGELLKFLTGVRDFLSDTRRFKHNEGLNFWKDLKNYLLDDKKMMNWEKNPSARIYYVVLGKWKNERELTGCSEQFEQDLKALRTYDEIYTHYIDSEGLKKICDNNKNTFSVSLQTNQLLPLTEVQDVSNSCMALCYARDFVSVLQTDEGLIRKQIFNDNVRDFQGENSVNSEIEQTIINNPTRFILMNNGITIVCDEYKQQNTRLTLKNPQVVNGCQTSYVIFNAFNKSIDISNVPLTIKIISTESDEISNAIVRGTNRQNIVYEEAFESTKKFHKDLEQFFLAMHLEFPKLYYERRSKQYMNDPTIKQTQKINLRVLTKYYVGMFLNKPHDSSLHESVLLKRYANDIYKDHHSFLPYFLTGMTFSILENNFRKKRLRVPRLFSKPHICMMFREAIAGQVCNLNNQKSSDKYCEKIKEFLHNNDTVLDYFVRLSKIYSDECYKWIDEEKKSNRLVKVSSEFTDRLLNQVRNQFSMTSKTIINKTKCEKLVGKVIKVRVDFNGYYYGFIERQPDNVFFHSNFNKSLDFPNLEDKFVEYEIVKKGNKTYAKNVQLIDNVFNQVL